MKKTYYAPEMVSVKLNTVHVMATSETHGVDKSEGNAIGQGGQFSNSYSGGLWDDTIEDE